jgi:hypothetical protein
MAELSRWHRSCYVIPRHLTKTLFSQQFDDGGPQPTSSCKHRGQHRLASRVVQPLPGRCAEREAAGKGRFAAEAEHMAQATVQPRSIRLSNSTTRTAEAHMIERVLNGGGDANTARGRKALSTECSAGGEGSRDVAITHRISLGRSSNLLGIVRRISWNRESRQARKGN